MNNLIYCTSKCSNDFYDPSNYFIEEISNEQPAKIEKFKLREY